jgi:aromatic ring-opening dioxygenase catalytic subunit (LigB family)
MIALEPGEAGAFLQRLGPRIDATFGRPRAILSISAHTAARVPVLLAAPSHAAIHDFGGFDPKLRTLRYDVAGAPALAARVAGLLQGAGIAVEVVRQGGLDHGAWTALRYLYPAADIPVLPLAFVPDQIPARQFALGEALAPLAAEGVLVLGSGSITHNLRRVFAHGLQAPSEQPEIPESAAFRAWMQARTKKPMKPIFTPCFFSNRSLYWLRMCITALMSTSLNVVSMAAVFCASLRRRAMVCRRRDIRTRSSFLSSFPRTREPRSSLFGWAPAFAGVTNEEGAWAPTSAGELRAGAPDFCASAAAMTSSLVSRPSLPEPLIRVGST